MAILSIPQTHADTSAPPSALPKELRDLQTTASTGEKTVHPLPEPEQSKLPHTLQEDVDSFIQEAQDLQPKENAGAPEQYSVTTVELGTAADLGLAKEFRSLKDNGLPHPLAWPQVHLEISTRLIAERLKATSALPDLEDADAIASQAAKLIGFSEQANNIDVESALTALQMPEISERAKQLIMRELLLHQILESSRNDYTQRHAEKDSKPREVAIIYVGSVVSKTPEDTRYITRKQSDIDWFTPGQKGKSISDAILMLRRKAYPRQIHTGKEVQLRARLISSLSPTSYIGWGEPGTRNIGFSIEERFQDNDQPNCKLADSLLFQPQPSQDTPDIAAGVNLSNFFYRSGERRVTLAADWDGEALRYTLVILDHNEDSEIPPKLHLRRQFAEKHAMYETDWEQIVKHLGRTLPIIQAPEYADLELSDFIEPAVLLECRRGIASLSPVYRATDYDPQDREFIAPARKDMCNYVLDFCYKAGNVANRIIREAGLDPNEYQDLEEAREALNAASDSKAGLAERQLRMLVQAIEIMGIPELYNTQLYGTLIDKKEFTPWITELTRDQKKQLTHLSGASSATALRPSEYSEGDSTLRMITHSHLAELRRLNDEIFATD